MICNIRNYTTFFLYKHGYTLMNKGSIILKSLSRRLRKPIMGDSTTIYSPTIYSSIKIYWAGSHITSPKNLWPKKYCLIFWSSQTWVLKIIWWYIVYNYTLKTSKMTWIMGIMEIIGMESYIIFWGNHNTESIMKG